MENKYKTSDEIKEPALIGREDNLQELQDMCTQMEENKIPKFVVLQGEQGIGKSRLARELRLTVLERKGNIDFIEEICKPGDEQYPFSRVVDLFLQIYEKFGTLPLKHYQNGAPAMLKPDFIEFAISSVSHENPINIYKQVEGDPAKIFASAWCYILSHACLHPMCIVWENIHNIDRESADFLFYMVENLKKGDPVISIVLYRGDERSGENNFQRVFPKFHGKENVVEIKLDPILARETIPFVRSLLGPVRVDQYDLMPLYQVTHGNPYQLIDFMRSIADQKKIQWQDGSWQIEINRDILTRPPRGIEEQLIKNMGNLGSNHTKILEWLAIASSPLSIDFLSTLTSLKAMQLSLVFSDLVKEKYLIQEENAQVYAISSSNIEAEIVKRIEAKQQQKMHNQIARVIEKSSTEKESLLKIADHYHKGDDAKKSLQYSLDAGRWLVNQKRLRLALQYYRQALQLARDSKSKNILEIITELGFLLVHMGNHTEALQYFNEIVPLATKPDEQFQVKKGKGFSLYGLRKNAQALKEFNDAMRIPQKQKDPEMLLYHSSLELYRFQLKKAKTYLEEAKPLVSSHQELVPLLRKQEGLVEFYLGNWKEANAALHAAEELFTELQSNQDLVETLLSKAYLLGNTKSIDKAKETMEEALQLLKDSEDWYLVFQAQYLAGIFAWDQRDFENARQHFEKVEAIAKKSSEREGGYGVLGMALCALYSKETGTIESLVQKVLEIANTYNDKFLTAETYCVLARFHILNKQFTDALRYLDYSRDAFNAIECNWKSNRLATFYARLFTLSKQPKKGLDMLVESEKQARQRADIYHLADNYFERGFLLGFNKKFSEAAQWFHHAVELYSKLGKRTSAKDASVNEEKCRQACS